MQGEPVDVTLVWLARAASRTRDSMIAGRGLGMSCVSRVANLLDLTAKKLGSKTAE